MKKGNRTGMPKAKDDNNYKHDVTDKGLVIENNKIIKTTKTINSQRKAAKEYENKLEQLTVRLPQGSRQKLNDYVAESNKYNSVNAMIKDLLEKEIKQKLD